MERRRGAAKKMDQFFEIKNIFFLLFLDVKTGGFDDAVYFACIERILTFSIV